jgi:hypothetical protein
VEDLDRALGNLGFRRFKGRYICKGISYFIEFPSGPLGIGSDSRIKPVWTGRGSARTLALSATDACRDRLAAFYHWNDRQGLGAAVAITARNHVAFQKIREWSRREGYLEKYALFIAELHRNRELESPRKQDRRKSSKR